MYLIIDVSTTYGGIGLWEDATLVRTASWRSRHNHTSELMPSIESSLAAVGATVRQLQGIAVAIGPGGFSALRAGLGVAKGFAYAAGLPMVGVNTLEATAYPYRGLGFPICPSVVAGKGLIAWARFEMRDGVWLRRSKDQVSAPDAITGARGRPCLYCGEGAVLHASALRQTLGVKAHLVEEPSPLSRLQGVAELGVARLEKGSIDSTAGLQPHYLRPPGITPPKPPRPVRTGAQPKGPR